MGFIPVWVIITIVLLVLLMILFRTTNQIYLLSLIKENFFYFFAIAVFVFFAFSLTHIHSTYDIDVTSKEGLAEAGKIYWVWAVNVFKNLGKVTGYAAQQNWINTTNSTG